MYLGRRHYMRCLSYPVRLQSNEFIVCSPLCVILYISRPVSRFGEHECFPPQYRYRICAGCWRVEWTVECEGYKYHAISCKQSCTRNWGRKAKSVYVRAAFHAVGVDWCGRTVQRWNTYFVQSLGFQLPSPTHVFTPRDIGAEWCAPGSVKKLLL